MPRDFRIAIDLGSNSPMTTCRKVKEMIAMMNEMVVKNKAAGLYDGCKMAVEEAMKM